VVASSLGEARLHRLDLGRIELNGSSSKNHSVSLEDRS
jgi:hypothetical protein